MQVLAQQSREQARLSTNPTAPETSAPADSGNVIASLPPSIRQQVLADMDDSQVAFLPPDLAAEAQTLRRELEERHRRLMQDRLYSQGLPPVILGDTLLSLIIMAVSSLQWIPPDLETERRNHKTFFTLLFSEQM